MSDQTPITFHNVAACFTEEQWRLLENWQKELYQNVMQEIHEALITLGYTIANTDIVFKIKKNDKSCVRIDYDSTEREDTTVGDLPDILIRIKEEPVNEIPCSEERQEIKEEHQFSEPFMSYNTIMPDVSLNTNEGEESQNEMCLDSKIEQNVTDLPDNNSANSFCVQTNGEIYSINQYDYVGLENYINQTGGSVLVMQEDIDHINDTDCLQEKEVLKHSIRTVVINEEEPDPTNYVDYLPRKEFLKDHSKLDQVFQQQEEAAPISNNHFDENQIAYHYDTSTQFTENNEAQKYWSDVPEMQFKVVQWSEPSNERTYICPDCGKCFLCRSSLIKHSKVHQDEVPYKCLECDQSFPGLNFLVLHQRRVHTEERPYSCKYCQKSYINKSTLNKHIKSHTGERPYGCEVCGKSYSHNYHLVRHQRVHTGERPYECTLCEKRFYRKATLDKHQIVHTRQKKPLNTVLV